MPDPEGNPVRHPSGVLDTSVYLDLAALDPQVLPVVPEITTVTLAELYQGVALAGDASARAHRAEQVGAAVADFEALPFDARAAARYGSLVARTVSVGRSPKPRRMDLMIAAIASSADLPLYTRNAADFAHLDGLLTIVEV